MIVDNAKIIRCQLSALGMKHKYLVGDIGVCIGPEQSTEELEKAVEVFNAKIKEDNNHLLIFNFFGIIIKKLKNSELKLVRTEWRLNRRAVEKVEFFMEQIEAMEELHKEKRIK